MLVIGFWMMQHKDAETMGRRGSRRNPKVERGVDVGGLRMMMLVRDRHAWYSTLSLPSKGWERWEPCVRSVPLMRGNFLPALLCSPIVSALRGGEGRVQSGPRVLACMCVVAAVFLAPSLLALALLPTLGVAGCTSLRRFIVMQVSHV